MASAGDAPPAEVAADGEKTASQKAFDAVAKWDAMGVDVDKKTLEGRKANRGFTIAMGKTTADADASMVRKDKRAQTMPATNMRRGDHILSADSQAKMFEMNETLVARYRRGSVNVVQKIIKDEEFEGIWKDKTTLHMHGKMTDGQAHSDERERVLFPASAQLPGEKDKTQPVISCHKGSKGFRDTTPNQDNFSLTYFKNGWTLACAFDGHGPFGHIVSTRTVQSVPYFMGLDCGGTATEASKKPVDKGGQPHIGSFPESADGDFSRMPEALIYGFEMAQKELVAHALENCWDVQASGSTAVACIWKDNVVWTANAGDSRCVVGSEKDRTLIYETTDHKPDTPAEKERIEASGGEVRTQTYPDGWVNHRIFVKGEDYPGLCMARTLGDESVKAHGVIATPQCEKCEMDMKNEPFILLASDGVWEFLDSEFVIKAVAKKIKTDGPEKTVQKLQREAKKRWRQEEGDYCDDITSILIRLTDQA